MVVLAFLIPLGLLVRTLATERALTPARQVPAALAPVLIEGTPEQVSRAIGRLPTAGTVTVVSSTDEVIGGPPVPEARLARARAGEAFTDTTETGTAVVTPVSTQGGLAVVHVDVPNERLQAGVREAWAVLGGLGVLLVAGAVVVADRLGRRVVDPTTQVAAAARRLAAGDADARAPVEGPPEIADVAAALNTLADHIDVLVAAEREAAADLSHRLRTPLTALRLDVEALGDTDAGRRLAEDVHALEAAIDRVIRLARTPAGARAHADLAGVVAERVTFWTPLAEDENRQVTMSIPGRPVPVEVDRETLGALLDALVGNVLDHTPAGTSFAVEVGLDASTAVLTVTDHGPGFADGAVLGRGVSLKGSTGLGLDIVRRTAEAAGGTVRLDVAEGGGAAVTVTLPLASLR